MNSLKELHDKLAAENKEKRKWAVEAATDDYREQFNAMADAYSISCYAVFTLEQHIKALLRRAEEKRLTQFNKEHYREDIYKYWSGQIDILKEILGET